MSAKQQIPWSMWAFVSTVIPRQAGCSTCDAVGESLNLRVVASRSRFLGRWYSCREERIANPLFLGTYSFVRGGLISYASCLYPRGDCQREGAHLLLSRHNEKLRSLSVKQMCKVSERARSLVPRVVGDVRGNIGGCSVWARVCRAVDIKAGRNQHDIAVLARFFRG